MDKGKIKKGDILLVKDGATIGKTAIVIEEPREKMAVNEHVFILRPNNLVTAKFLYYLICSNFGFAQIKLTETGSAQGGINTRFPDKVLFSIPERIEKQDAITTFLGLKISEIDRIIQNEEKIISLLKEKRAALVDKAVTKGLELKVQMKDSRVEWIGAIPEHWTVMRSKNIFREIDDRSEYGDEELLTVSHITGVTRRSEKKVTMFMAKTLSGYKKCKAGDLVINTMWAWMGALGTAGQDGIVSPSYNVYRLRNTLFEPRYFDRLFRTKRFVSVINRYSKGVWTSRLRLYPKEFFQIRIPVPPVDEQIVIAEFLQKEIGSINKLVLRIHEYIEKLFEYRSAVISDAVAGKIEVEKEVSINAN